jgi:hypothetical protein
MSNLKMILEVVLHSLVHLEAHKTWSCTMPRIQGNETIFNQNQINDEYVENFVHRNACLQFIHQGNKRKDEK